MSLVTRLPTYEATERFRSQIVMARHGFGRGAYKYFAYPLPEVVASLRTALYLRLSGIANRAQRSRCSTNQSRVEVAVCSKPS